MFWLESAMEAKYTRFLCRICWYLAETKRYEQNSIRRKIYELDLLHALLSFAFILVFLDGLNQMAISSSICNRITQV